MDVIVPAVIPPKDFAAVPRTDIQIPPGVDRQQFIRQLLASIEPGESQAAGIDSSGSFYLDVGALSRINESKVQNLLSATSAALQKVWTSCQHQSGNGSCSQYFD